MNKIKTESRKEIQLLKLRLKYTSFILLEFGVFLEDENENEKEKEKKKEGKDLTSRDFG